MTPLTLAPVPHLALARLDQETAGADQALLAYYKASSDYHSLQLDRAALRIRDLETVCRRYGLGTVIS